MWWKILIGFFVVRSLSQPQAASAQSVPMGVMTMKPPITSPMTTPAFQVQAPITSPMTPPLQQNSLILTRPFITSPLFDNTGASKLMSPAPALGGSAGYEF